MPMKNPPHPGDLIKTEVIEALGLSVSKAADVLKVRRATLSDLLHGKAALTPEARAAAHQPRAVTVSAEAFSSASIVRLMLESGI